MSKTQLQTNNAKLSALITELQGKAAGGGSGGSVETCTVTIGEWAFETISYVGVNGLVVNENAESDLEQQREVQKGTIFYGYISDSTMYSVTGDATLLYESRNICVVAVYGDCTIISE